MQETNWTSRIVTGLCFAIPAAAFSWRVSADRGQEFCQWVPLATSGATFITAVLLWRLFAERFEGLAVEICAGAAVGVAAHPVAAVISALIMIVRHGTDPIKAISFVLFWWSLYAACFVGWVTMALGALIGGMMGVSRSLVDDRRQRNQSANAHSGGQAHSRENGVRSGLRRARLDPTPATTSALLALGIICLLTVVTLAAFSLPGESLPFAEPFEKPAGLDQSIGTD